MGNERIILHVYFTNAGEKYYSDEDIALPGDNIYIQGNVATFGVLYKSLNPQKGLFSISDLNIIFDNSDNYFEKLLQSERDNDKDFINREIKIYLADVSQHISTWKTIFIGIIDNYEFGEGIFELKVSDNLLRYLSDTNLSLNTWVKNDTKPDILDEWDPAFIGSCHRKIYGRTSVNDAYALGQPNGLTKLKFAGKKDRYWQITHTASTFALGDKIVGDDSNAEGEAVTIVSNAVTVVKDLNGWFEIGEVIRSGAKTATTSLFQKLDDYYYYYVGSPYGASYVFIPSELAGGKINVFLDDRSAALAHPNGFGLTVNTLDVNGHHFIKIACGDKISPPNQMICSADIEGINLETPGSRDWKTYNPIYILKEILEIDLNVPSAKIDSASFDTAALVAKNIESASSPGSYIGYRCALMLSENKSGDMLIQEICSQFLIDLYIGKDGNIYVSLGNTQTTELDISQYDILPDSLKIVPQVDALKNRLDVKMFYRFGENKYHLIKNTDDDIFTVETGNSQTQYAKKYDEELDMKYHCDKYIARGVDDGSGMHSAEAATKRYIEKFSFLDDFIHLSIPFNFDNIDNIELTKIHTILHENNDDEVEKEIFSLSFDLDKFIVNIVYRDKEPSPVYEDVPFFVSGYDGSVHDDTYKFDKTAETWSTVTGGELPANRKSGSAFVINDNAYYVAGHDGSNYCSTTYKFNKATKIWSDIGKPLPAARSNGSVFVINNFAYYVGGWDGNAQDDLYRFNPTNETWYRYDTGTWITGAGASVKTLIANRSSGSAFVIGGYAYYVAGYSGSNPVNNTYKFDPATELFTNISKLYPNNVYGLVTFVIGGYAYGVGGWEPQTSNVSNKTYRFDPANETWYRYDTGTWITGAGGSDKQLPVNSYFGSAFVINDYAYHSGGGAPVAPLAQDDTYKFDPVTELWSTVTGGELPANRREGSAFILSVEV